MSWSDFVPPVLSKAIKHHPVSLACTVADGRFRQRLVVTVRPALLGGLGWWLGGATVAAA